MRTADFHYDLPRELIAQYPIEPRSASRLLVLDGASGEVQHLHFGDLTRVLRPGDLLVFNNTRVIPARLFGRKETGGRVELLVERILDDRRVLAQARASKPLRLGDYLHLEGDVCACVVARCDDFYELRIEHGEPVVHVLERIGHVPLPPYITRSDEAGDREHYQTIYAEMPGAIAAPTAGLHFDANMFEQLAAASVDTAFLTLHIGAGTFQPVRVADIRDHLLHPEYVNIGRDVCVSIDAAKSRGSRIVAVGTTVVRALETAARQGRVEPFADETDLFVYPGYRFKVVDALLTNFHLPESTLLMLVCAFAGTEQVLNAYRHAVKRSYRFYSYGDAMFVLPRIQDARGEIQGI